MVKNLFVTATRPNEGKTAITIGLTSALIQRVKRIGFIKPIGQPDLGAGRHRVDEDTLLVEKACRVHCNLDDMNPIKIETGGFPQSLMNPAVRESQIERLKTAYARIAENKEIVVIEGTGHAAVGASFGLSNAHVAKLFDARVILVSSGGVGHPVDEILLSKRYFEHEGVSIIGVIVNKVRDHEWNDVNTISKSILEEHGVRYLGAIPFKHSLYVPTLMQVLEELRGELLHGENKLNATIGNISVGAMSVSNALQRLNGPTLLVVPGDRDDLILGALSARAAGWGDFQLTGLILTGNLHPSRIVIEVIKKLDVPAILVEPNSYETAARLNGLTVKISPWDRDKIDEIIKTFAEHVNTEWVLSLI